MFYLERHIEKVLKMAENQTKVILLTGPRQVGKSTSIQRVYPGYTYITLDNDDELTLAKRDRALFFKDRKFPLIVDEVQYAEELFRQIKLIVDKKDKKGQVFITGSQTYDLLSLSSETLAGRISILSMNSLSCREIFHIPFYDAFLPNQDYLDKRKGAMREYNGIWEFIQRGFMPEMLDPNRDWEWFYRDYVKTYIERDIRRIVNVKDELKFRKLIISLAARSSKLLVYGDIARDVEIDIKTAQHWISVIAASGLIKIVYPYHNNAIKRAIKTPKVFFMDTGLLCYLVGWNSAQSAENGAMSGAIFETFVVSEIIKSFENAGKEVDRYIFFYRDRDGKELDLVIEDNNCLYPIEIKKGASIDRAWGKHFPVFDKITDKKVMDGTVICRTDEIRNVTERVRAVPVEYI